MSLTGSKSRRIILKPRSSSATPQVLLVQQGWRFLSDAEVASEVAARFHLSSLFYLHRCFTSQMLRFGLPRLEPDPLPGKKCCSNARTPIASSVVSAVRISPMRANCQNDIWTQAYYSFKPSAVGVGLPGGLEN